MYKPLAIAALLSVTAQAWAHDAPERVAALDYATLDILDNLDQDEHIAGVAQSTLPEHLSAFASEEYADVGTLKEADMAALGAIEPDEILISGRLEAQRDALEQIAPVYSSANAGDTTWDQLETRVDQLAERFHISDEGDQALEDLRHFLDQRLATIDGSPSVLVVTHNDGHFSAQNNAIVHDLMGLAAPSLPDDVTPVTRGERTFLPMTPAQIQATGADLVWIVDRSAAIGEAGLDLATLQQDIGADTRLAVGSPRLWYLAGQGLASTRLQVEEVMTALAR